MRFLIDLKILEESKLHIVQTKETKIQLDLNFIKIVKIGTRCRDPIINSKKSHIISFTNFSFFV